MSAPEGWDENVSIPLRILDPEAWARMCNGPTVWEERWRVVPFGAMFAVRYEPVGKDNPEKWKDRWRIVAVCPTAAEAERVIREEM